MENIFCWRGNNFKVSSHVLIEIMENKYIRSKENVEIIRRFVFFLRFIFFFTTDLFELKITIRRWGQTTAVFRSTTTFSNQASHLTTTKNNRMCVYVWAFGCRRSRFFVVVLRRSNDRLQLRLIKFNHAKLEKKMFRHFIYLFFQVRLMVLFLK